VTESWERSLGKLEGEVSGLQAGQAALRRDMAALRAETSANFAKVYEKLDEAKEALAQGKGGLRAMILFVGGVGVVVGWAVPYIFHLH
jgi:hypothetical protein